MTLKISTVAGCVAASLLVMPTLCAYAEDEEESVEDTESADDVADEEGEEPAEPSVDEALEAEIRYVETLVDCGYPDFAEIVIEETKRKWPAAETRFFAIEIRGMLSLGKFEEAEAKIAALPDRKSSKYWAARIEVAINYASRGLRKECAAIFEEFFEANANPPPELKDFYMQASYTWGQLLMSDGKREQAAAIFAGMTKNMDKYKTEDSYETWCNVSAKTADLYLALAADQADAAARGKFLDTAKPIVDSLLWEQGKPVYFGRAIAMKANIELLRGDVGKAQATIDEYMDQLAEIHHQLEEFDPDGRKGALELSPMPLCRYMLAEMLWNEVKAESKKAKRDDEKIKALMFGEKLANGKRNNAGAYNHALNVFIKYPDSPWAAKAGPLAEEVKAFAEKTYGAKIATAITPEQMKKVMAKQFANANQKLADGEYAEAIAAFYKVLSDFPEAKESIGAIESLIEAHLRYLRNDPDKDKAEELRIDADAIEGYLAERFAGASKELMTLAGDAVMRVAAREKESGQLARADHLYREFMINYRDHVNASVTAAAMAGEAQRDEKWADALALWKIVAKYYTNSMHYASSIYSASYCLGKLGDSKGQIEAMKKYVEVEKSKIKREQARMALAQLYQKEGFDIIAGCETNESAEAAAKQLSIGSAQIIRGIKEFKAFAAEADKALGDPGVQASDKQKYSRLKEQALYLTGDCWRRLTKPEAKIDDFRRNAAASFEEYLDAYPEGAYSTNAYVRLGTIYTALGDMEKSKDALDRLSKKFPDSREAKNAKPQLAKSLIEMGLKKEGTDIYAEMLKTDGAYTAAQFVNAGEALIDARSWDLANKAFEKAIAKAGTNQQYVVAKARIGEANALYRQKNLVEAREALDMFLADEKMAKLSLAADAYFLMIEIASEQGRGEKDAKLRDANFGAAIGAVKKLRNVYWKKKPLHERNRLDLMSSEIKISRMKAEETMGLNEAAMDTCANAAASLQAFLQSNGPSEAKPVDKMSAGELENLEKCYELMIPLFAKMGSDQADRVMKFGQEYLDMFPNGRTRTEVQNCMNQARASGVAPSADAAVAVRPSEPAAEDSETPVEGESEVESTMDIEEVIEEEGENE